MDKIKGDGDEWLKTRDVSAKANAAVCVGETAEQPLVVSNLGQVQQETYIGTKIGKIWLQSGDSKCHTCECDVEVQTQFAHRNG